MKTEAQAETKMTDRTYYVKWRKINFINDEEGSVVGATESNETIRTEFYEFMYSVPDKQDIGYFYKFGTPPFDSPKIGDRWGLGDSVETLDEYIIVDSCEDSSYILLPVTHLLRPIIRTRDELIRDFKFLNERMEPVERDNTDDGTIPFSHAYKRTEDEYDAFKISGFESEAPRPRTSARLSAKRKRSAKEALNVYNLRQELKF